MSPQLADAAVGGSPTLGFQRNTAGRSTVCTASLGSRSVPEKIRRLQQMMVALKGPSNEIFDLNSVAQAGSDDEQIWVENLVGLSL